jgi:hypothetical protein
VSARRDYRRLERRDVVIAGVICLGLFVAAAVSYFA